VLINGLACAFVARRYPSAREVVLIGVWFGFALRRRRLYYTQIRIGSPAKGYYVQVDTGSDVLWVNCIRCDGCPTKGDLGVPFLLRLQSPSQPLSFLPGEYSFTTVQCHTSVPPVFFVADKADAV
jgi:hypothetical protein